LPQGKTGYPVVFWIHGGELHSGDKSKITEVAGHPDVAIHELKDRTHNSIRPNLEGRNDLAGGYIRKFISRLTKPD
jgi:hypothetical protein